MNFGLQTLGDGSVEYLYGEIDNCPMENHRCLPNGSPFQAAMGLDAATMRKAAAHEADDLAHNDSAGELALAERRMIMSQCAYDHKSCGDDGKCNLEACDNGFVGPSCQYLKTTMACTTDDGHEVIAERAAKSGKKWFDDSPLGVDVFYEGMNNNKRTPKDFIVYCLVGNGTQSEPETQVSRTPDPKCPQGDVTNTLAFGAVHMTTSRAVRGRCALSTDTKPVPQRHVLLAELATQRRVRHRQMAS